MHTGSQQIVNWKCLVCRIKALKTYLPYSFVKMGFCNNGELQKIGIFYLALKDLFVFPLFGQHEVYFHDLAAY